MLDLDVDDAFISTVGAGVDVVIAEGVILNFEGRYQFAEFDLHGSVLVPGIGTVKIDDDVNLDSWVLRAGVLLEL